MSEGKFPKPGDWMIFTGRNGYDHEQAECRRFMQPGAIIQVERIDIEAFSSTIRPRGFAIDFNSVMFEPFDPTPFVNATLQREADGLREALRRAREFVEAEYEMRGSHADAVYADPAADVLLAIDAALNGSPQAPTSEDNKP